MNTRGRGIATSRRPSRWSSPRWTCSGKASLPNYLGQTLGRLVVGSLIGIALGIPFGILLGLNRHVAEMFYPLLNFFQSISGIALLPILMIWWGTTEKTVSGVILYTCFFPIAFNVLGEMLAGRRASAG